MKTIDACEAAYKNGYTAGYEAAESKIVHCKECKYLMFSDMYGECGRGIMGVVSPGDYCSRGEKK